MQLGALITAAGAGEREGEFTPMANIGSISVAQRVVGTLRQAGAARIVMVTGCNAQELERSLAGQGLIFLRNEDYARTEMLDSVKIGLRYLAGKCDAVLFTPVDIPLFTAETVRALAASGAGIACPDVGGRTGHPILISAGLIYGILGYTGGGGLKGAIKSLGVEAVRVPVPDEGTLFDAHGPGDCGSILDYHNSRLIRAEVSVRLARETEFLDSRLATLLMLTDETGSVREACQKMQMSYSSGWNAIRTLENELGFTVVSRTQGGARGGSSSLTAEGEELLSRYEGFRRELCAEADRLFERHFAGMFGGAAAGAAKGKDGK